MEKKAIEEKKISFSARVEKFLNEIFNVYPDSFVFFNHEATYKNKEKEEIFKKLIYDLRNEKIDEIKKTLKYIKDKKLGLLSSPNKKSPEFCKEVKEEFEIRKNGEITEKCFEKFQEDESIAPYNSLFDIKSGPGSIVFAFIGPELSLHNKNDNDSSPPYRVDNPLLCSCEVTGRPTPSPKNENPQKEIR